MSLPDLSATTITAPVRAYLDTAGLPATAAQLWTIWLAAGGLMLAAASPEPVTGQS